MICMSRVEVLDKLMDYNNLYSLMRMFPNSRIIDLYYQLMNEKRLNNMPADDSIESFKVMIRIQDAVNVLRIFSLCEEGLLDFTNDNSINIAPYKKNIKDGGIFVEGNGNEFSNKQIFKYIRNAFNHNDDPKYSRFNFSRNGKYIEIFLKDVRSDKEKNNSPDKLKPFHIKIATSELFPILNEFIRNANYAYGTFYIFDDKLIRIHLDEKMPSNKKYEMNRLSFNSSEDSFAKYKKFLDENGIKYTVENYELNSEQKEWISYTKKRIRNNTMNKKIDYNLRGDAFEYSIKEIIPSPAEKLVIALNDCYFLPFIQPYQSYNDIKTKFDKMYLKNSSELEPYEKTVLSSFWDNENLKRKFLYNAVYYEFNRHDIDLTLYYALNNCYIDGDLQLFKHGKLIKFIGDEEGKFSLKEHVRNSLTHGWFFINYKGDYVFYDRNNHKKDDYRYYCDAKINRNLLIDETLQRIKDMQYYKVLSEYPIEKSR